MGDLLTNYIGGFAGLFGRLGGLGWLWAVVCTRSITLALDAGFSRFGVRVGLLLLGVLVLVSYLLGCISYSSNYPPNIMTPFCQSLMSPQNYAISYYPEEPYPSHQN